MKDYSNFTMNSIKFLIRQVDWELDRETLRHIREQVFVREQRVPVKLEWDGRDDDALHLLAQHTEGQAIGTARMLPDGHIGRVAVLPAWRRRGVGGALLRELVHIARSGGCTRPYLNAQTHALDFYRRYGFVAAGPEFIDAGILHQRMVLSP